MKKTTALIGVSLLVSNLYGGFDFGGSDGSGCDGGDGTFQQQIEYWNNDPEKVVTVGTIPKDLKDVYISLKSDNDVDIRLYDANGKKIVHWPNGILYDYGKATTTYNGVTIEYSGYNGDGTGLGHEYIKISGTTQNDFIMKAFGYKAGYAKVDYSWAGKANCSDSSTPSASGLGTFQQNIITGDIVTVGDIPKNINSLYIKLISDEDVDIQLYDKDNGKKIVHWPNGIINGAGKQSTNYEGMTIEWSGYNGDGTGLGHEYINIIGKTTKNLTMKAYGYKAGSATVNYYWGEEKNDVFLVEKKSNYYNKINTTSHQKASENRVKTLLNKLVTSNDSASTLKILSILKNLNKFNELINGVSKYDDSRHQALFVLEFIVRNSKHILGGKALKEGSLVRVAKLIEKHNNSIALANGEANIFYIFIEEDGFLWDSNIELENITLYPITQYNFYTQQFEYVAETSNSSYSKKSWSWNYGHGFWDIPFGLYLAEFERGDKICSKAVYVDTKAESTISWLLAKGKCE